MFVVSPRTARTSVVIDGVARRVENNSLLAPLDAQQAAALDGLQVWVVEYRDEFSHDENPNAYERYDYPAAVCFSRDDAEAEASRRGERFKPGWAGFDVRGPVAPTTAFIDDGHGDNILRVILERLASGSRRPISLREG